MTDLPDPAADETAAARTLEIHTPSPAGPEPAGDPELAALVRHAMAAPPGDTPSRGDPELAALVAHAPLAAAPAAAPEVGAAPAAALPAAAPEVAVVAAPSPEPAAPVVGERPTTIAGDPAAAPLVAAAPETPAADRLETADTTVHAEATPEAASGSPPGAADLAPGAADLAPGAADLAPGAADLAPGAADLAPGAADLAPGAAESPTAVIEAGPAAQDELAAAAAAKPSAEIERPSSHRGRALFLRFALAFVFGVVLVGAIGASALYAWGQQYDGRVLPGVHLGGTDLSGLTRDQAQAAIAKALGPLGSGHVVLNGPDGKTTLAFSDLGRGPDIGALLDAALGAGRQGEPFADLIGGPQAALHGVALDPAVTYDRAKLVAAVDALAAGIDQAAVNASVSVAAGGTFSVTAATDGRAVDRAALVAALDRQLTALNAPAEINLDVPVVTVVPTVTTDAADAAKQAADRMAADLVIARGTDTWTIGSDTLAPLITFTVGQDGSVTPVFQAAGLDPLVKQLATQVNQTAQDAQLKLAGDHVVASGMSREGRTLDVAGMEAAIVSQMAARQAGTAIEPLAAVVKAVQPKLSTDQATAFAAEMVPISSFSVYYWVIINNYWGGNIEAPATKINGTVVPPGGVFDFWKVVGDLHQIPGVGPGNAIEGGKITVTGAFGGGICTTSTTLFNAALRAGMVPGARQNHNEFIDRYPPGLDATVWIVGSAKQTMSFTNDTAYPILIQRVISNAGGGKRWLTFKIWSVPNNRTTKITNLVIQPGAKAIDTIEKDPTHPVGWSYRVNTPVNGAKVWVTVTIYDHGQLHWTKTYYSNYPPVNGVLQVGTKGAPTPTPSPSPSPSPAP